MTTKLFALLLAPLLFISCSTTDLYYQPLTQRPATPWKNSSSSWGGYIETSPKLGTYDIRYEAYNEPNADAAAYFTMLRAAERAAIDGKAHFYVTKPMLRNSRAEESYFPAYVKPGYWYTRKVRYCDTCPRTGNDINCDYYKKRFWYPEEYVPAENIVNYIHENSIRISYLGKTSTKQSTRKILREALADTRGYGKPKLDPRAMAFIRINTSK